MTDCLVGVLGEWVDGLCGWGWRGGYTCVEQAVDAKRAEQKKKEKDRKKKK